jgi:hypothetical protein
MSVVNKKCFYSVREDSRLGGERWKRIDGCKLGLSTRSSFLWKGPNPIAAGPHRPYGRIAKTMAPAQLDFLNPELPNPET